MEYLQCSGGKKIQPAYSSDPIKYLNNKDKINLFSEKQMLKDFNSRIL